MYRQSRQERLPAALAAAVMTAAIGWGLLAGLAASRGASGIAETLATFVVTPPPPPPEKTVPRPKVSKRAEGRAAPPNIRSKATQVVAPIPIVALSPPTPVIAAPKPFEGTQSTQGAAPTVGPGTGAGGVGDGTGSGGWGNGDGDGGDETPPRWRKGRLKDSDYPRGAGADGLQGTVSVRFLVWTDGRVRDCRVTRSSGNAVLDDTTCRLITERYRYDPSRDAEGRPVPAYILENHTWVVEDDPALR